jgi:hypothetical protein
MRDWRGSCEGILPNKCVACNYMEDKKEVERKNIQFQYAANVAPNVNREESMVHNINDWLGKSAEAINGQNGTIVVYFQNNKEQSVSFDGIVEDLQAILYKQLQKFQPQSTRQPANPAK